MSRCQAHTRLVVIAVVAACAVAALVAACGSTAESQMPTFSANATPGPKAHEATVRITSDGAGTASMALVLTDPDGHRSQLMSATWARSSSIYTASDLSAGHYTFTVYALPKNSDSAPAISVGYFTDEHKVAAAKVTVP